MKRTRICDLLRIEYPILQGGMLWLATAELAVAVSNAGALGTVSPHAGMDKKRRPFKKSSISDSKGKKFNEKILRR